MTIVVRMTRANRRLFWTAIANDRRNLRIAFETGVDAAMGEAMAASEEERRDAEWWASECDEAWRGE